MRPLKTPKTRNSELSTCDETSIKNIYKNTKQHTEQPKKKKRQTDRQVEIEETESSEESQGCCLLNHGDIRRTLIRERCVQKSSHPITACKIWESRSLSLTISYTSKVTHNKKKKTLKKKKKNKREREKERKRSRNTNNVCECVYVFAKWKRESD